MEGDLHSDFLVIQRCQHSMLLLELHPVSPWQAKCLPFSTGFSLFSTLQLMMEGSSQCKMCQHTVLYMKKNRQDGVVAKTAKIQGTRT